MLVDISNISFEYKMLQAEYHADINNVAVTMIMRITLLAKSMATLKMNFRISISV